MMRNSGTLVPVHSWGMPPCNEGTCANIIQLLNLGFHSLFSFWSSLWISLPGSGENGKSNITLQLWGLERPRCKICFMWSQTSSACGPTLAAICAWQKPCARFGTAGRNSFLFGTALRRMVGVGGVRHGGRGKEIRGAPSQGTLWGWTSQHPPTWQLFPIRHKKDNFGVVVSFPRKSSFAALTALLPDRRKAISKHSFLWGVREKSQIVGILWKFPLMATCMTGKLRLPYCKILSRVWSTLPSSVRSGTTLFVDNSGKTTLSYITYCKMESVPSYPMHYL